MVADSSKDNILDAYPDFHYNRSLAGRRFRNLVNQQLEWMSTFLMSAFVVSGRLFTHLESQDAMVREGETDRTPGIRSVAPPFFEGRQRRNDSHCCCRRSSRVSA
jgi:hypothetical protein